MLKGPGYVARIPPGFNVRVLHPAGGYYLWPPGSTEPPVSPAIVFVDPVHPMMVPSVLQHLHGMEDPFIGRISTMSLGLQKVTKLAPARQMPTPGGTAHIRELDGVSSGFQPVRMMVVLLIGTSGAGVLVAIAVNLHRWNEFIGPCLEFLGSVNASGKSPCTSNVFAVVDGNHPDQIQFSSGPDLASAVPWIDMPTQVDNKQVVRETHIHFHNNSTRIDKSVHVEGNITGANVVSGDHVKLDGESSFVPPGGSHA